MGSGGCPKVLDKITMDGVRGWGTQRLHYIWGGVELNGKECKNSFFLICISVFIRYKVDILNSHLLVCFWSDFGNFGSGI